MPRLSRGKTRSDQMHHLVNVAQPRITTNPVGPEVEVTNIKCSPPGIKFRYSKIQLLNVRRGLDPSMAVRPWWSDREVFPACNNSSGNGTQLI